MKSILDWFDHRTGYRDFVYDALYEPIPGGSKWRYVWGSTLIFTFMVQLVTGLFLWMNYSPSSQTAWESVYYVQHEMQFGWLLRGVHHFTAQAMVVLLAIHFMQILIDGAYRAPREVNFWLGLILMQIVLGLSLTGYLLPWDQKGYWATQVATKLAGIVPIVGPSIQKLVVGGSTYGHHTLTRFFAMHAGLLPGALIFFVILHVYVFRRHGITTKPTAEQEAAFWPDQVLKDSVACLGVLLVVLLLVFRHAPMSPAEWTQLSNDGKLGEVLGAELGAPADPSEPYSAARPEWYFLFLFQFLKYFPGTTEIYGAIVIPGAIFGFMFLMPFIGRWKLGHRFNIGYTFCLIAGAVALTVIAIQEDQNNPDYQHAVTEAEEHSKRIVELIEEQKGIGAEGARVLLHSDPKTRGRVIFKENCAQCHRYNGTDGAGHEPAAAAVASDLGKFGSREWLKGFLTNPAAPEYYGATTGGNFNGEPIGAKFTEGEMADWSKSNVSKMTPEEIDGVVEFLVAQANRPDNGPINNDLVKIGQEFFKNGNAKEATSCSSCHAIKIGEETIGDPAGGYPQLTGYASEDWLKSFITDPGAETHYADRNAMPGFKEKMNSRDLDILVRWMQKRWYEPPVKEVAAQ
ncbi:MAG: cytochrome b N-terminal domain-containing protein [Planctomycetaceae bacterium]